MEGLRAYPTDHCSVLYFCHYCTLGVESDTDKAEQISLLFL